MATKRATTKKITTKKVEAKGEKIQKFVGTVNTDQYDLNVREVPEGKVIKTLPKGSKIEYLKGADPDWYQLADGSGFVMASKIK